VALVNLFQNKIKHGKIRANVGIGPRCATRPDTHPALMKAGSIGATKEKFRLVIVVQIGDAHGRDFSTVLNAQSKGSSISNDIGLVVPTVVKGENLYVQSVPYFHRR
jgi:hypothetical protein